MNRGILQAACMLACLALPLSACQVWAAAPGDAPEALSYTPYDTKRLKVTPAPVEKGATEHTDSELIAIFDTLYPQARDAFTCKIFKVDESDTYNVQDKASIYHAIDNFSSMEEVVQNYEAIFTYDYFQGVIFPDYFIMPYTAGGVLENELPLIIDRKDKLYLNSNAVGLVASEKILGTEVISKSADSFEVRVTYEWVGGCRHPYVVTVVSQNGLWVLDNFYFFDIVEHTLLAS